MSDVQNRPARSKGAVRFDEMTLAAFTVAVMTVIATVLYLGGPVAGDRIACGLNDLVNRLMAYPRECYRPAPRTSAGAGVRGAETR